MVFGLIRKVFGKTDSSPQRATADAFDYEGFRVHPAPIKEATGWRVAGYIRKEVDGEQREHEFVRADVISTTHEAITTTAAKARRVIDEQGERLFEPRPTPPARSTDR